MKNRRLFALPLLALTATTAWAQESAICRTGPDFSDDPPFALAMVNGVEPAHFQRDTGGCHGYGQTCKPIARVVPGDIVIVSKVLAGLACALSPRDGTSGWIETRRLELPPVETNPPLAAWLGKWSSEGNHELNFEAGFDQLRVSGRASWPRADDTEGWTSTYDGSIEGPVDRTGFLGKYWDEHWRKVSFTLLGDYLIVSGASKDGGPKASFSAIYRRAQ